MVEKFQKQALELTQKILEEYWMGNTGLLFQNLHPDILWIGSTDQEYIHGKKEMKKRIQKNNAEMPRVYMDEQEYEVAHQDVGSCLVVGRYHVFTKAESQILLSEKQRVTFLWVKDKTMDPDKLWIRHLHLSNTIKIQGEDEHFPTREGQKNYEKMKKIVEERAKGDSITVRDSKHAIRVFNYTELAYLKADHNYTEFYTGDGICSARIRENISKYLAELPVSFLKVSRSYVINCSYVKSFKGRQLVMLDDTVIRIPAARCAETKHILNGHK